MFYILFASTGAYKFFTSFLLQPEHTNFTSYSLQPEHTNFTSYLLQPEHTNFLRLICFNRSTQICYILFASTRGYKFEQRIFSVKSI